MSTTIITKQQAILILSLVRQSNWVGDAEEIIHDMLNGTFCTPPISVTECRNQCRSIDELITQLNDIVEPSQQIEHPHVEQVLNEMTS